MRFLLINPHNKTIERLYDEPDTAVVNYWVQSSELRRLDLGQKHCIFIDEHWAIRRSQSFYSLLAAPDAILGGLSLMTGWDHEKQEIANCDLDAAAVLTQFVWMTPTIAEAHAVVRGLRSGEPMRDREIIQRFKGSVN